MEIICDTSFIIALVSNPIKCLDKVESEIGKLKFIVPTFVLDELDLIEKKSGPKKSMIANTAIRISKLKFEIKDIGNQKMWIKIFLITQPETKDLVWPLWMVNY